MRTLYNAASVRLDAYQGPEKLDRPIVKGYDLNQGLNYPKMFANLINTGF